MDRFRAPSPGIVVLLYHRVGGRSSSEVDLDAAVFAEQMAFLGDSTDVVRLERALEELTSPPDTARRRPAVVVTFDDGTDDFVDVAVPILLQQRIPVTLYLATAFVDEGRAFSGGGRPASWSGLTDACATGLVDIGSHTHRHRLLDRLPSVELADELDRSIELIGERLGRTAADFAYPKAVFGSRAEFLARVDNLIDEIHAAPTVAGLDRIMVPGDREFGHQRRAQREPLALSAYVAENVRLAAEMADLQIGDYLSSGIPPNLP